MSHPRGLHVVLTAILLMATTASAQHDPSHSHDQLPGRIDRAAAEKRLLDRFQIAAEKTPLGLLENVLKNPERYGLSRQALEDLAREMSKNPDDLAKLLNDERMRDMARQFAEQAKNNFTPEQME